MITGDTVFYATALPDEKLLKLRHLLTEIEVGVYTHIVISGPHVMLNIHRAGVSEVVYNQQVDFLMLSMGNGELLRAGFREYFVLYAPHTC